jgi:hypothetical protein
VLPCAQQRDAGVGKHDETAKDKELNKIKDKDKNPKP